MKRRIRDGLHAAAALTVGAILYLFLRGVEGFSPATLIRNHLPDACWAYALSFALGAVWEENRQTIWCCAAVAIVCGGLWERLQGVGWVSGTADGWDILAYLAGALLSVTIKMMKKRTDQP